MKISLELPLCVIQLYTSRHTIV